MVRVLVCAALVALLPGAEVSQSSTLHIAVRLAGADGVPAPVSRHALLISDDPPTAVPRRVLTSAAGTADLTLAPGTYVVESERPLRRLEKAYRWTQVVVVAPGRAATLVLDAANAEVSAGGTDAATTADAADVGEPGAEAERAAWHARVVTVWTPMRRAAGVVVDPVAGLVLAPGQIGASASAVEVQLASTMKVAGRILAVDAARDVTLIRINPAPLTAAMPSSPSCSTGFDAAAGQPAAPLVPLDGASPGDDVDLAPGERASVCAALMSIGGARGDAPPPAAPLPVEPARTLDPDALAEAMWHRAGSLNPYELSASDFEVRFITPVMVYAARHRPDGTPLRAEMEFGAWSDYVDDVRAVVYVRATPKRAENFWTTIARGAAMTQGVALPAFTRVKAGFSHLRLFCGSEEVAPIHPFVLEQPVSDTRVVNEGLYVFAPEAFASSCEPLRLVVYSQADPGKGDERVVSPAVIRQIEREFAPPDPGR